MNSDSDSDSATSISAAESEEDEITQDDRDTIRAKISTLSFEDLLKMKEELGSKVYNQTLFGSGTSKPDKLSSEFKRANKNRPREMSAKIRPKKLVIRKTSSMKSSQPRDPRFDPLCGSFDNKLFKNNYKFLNKVRLSEKKQLEEECKAEKDPARKEKIKYLIQRMDNQIREQEKCEKEGSKVFEEKKEMREKLKQGEKPTYKKKSVKRLEGLIEKYEELKKSNKLQKHIEKRSKKITGKHKATLE